MKTHVIVAAASIAASASAQDAEIGFSASSFEISGTSPATVRLEATFDVLGDGGLFGDPSLNLFNGDIVGAGPATILNVEVNPALTVGFNPGTAVGASLSGVGGTAGNSEGPPPPTAVLLEFDVFAGPAALPGDTVTLTFEGAIAVDPGSDSPLILYSTNFLFGAQPLPAASLTLTVRGAASCNSADLAEPFGVLNSADVTSFVNAFRAGDDVADIAPPSGVLNSADVTSFVNAFRAGCP